MSKFKQNLITRYFSTFIKNSNDSNDTNDINDSNCIVDIEKNPSYIINIYGYNKETGNWHCLECGENMGDNPRQLCGKSYCMNMV